MCLESTSTPHESYRKNGRQMEQNKPIATRDSSVHVAGEHDGLRIRRVAGGYLVQYPPIFSQDGNLLFVIYENSIQAFSVTTGDFVRNYESNDGTLIGMVLDSTNEKYIYGCTVDGHILSWKIDSGLLSDRVELMKNKFVAESFHILYDQNGSSSFLVLGKSNKKLFIQYCPSSKKVLDTIRAAIHSAPSKERKKEQGSSASKFSEAYNTRILAAAGGHGLNYFAYIAKNRWYWVLLKPRVYVDSMPHCGGVEPTIVACHPTDAIVAIGDKVGRVVLYRNFLQREKIIAETYHWHPHPVKCLTFSRSGTHFYSGGYERVLIKWCIGQEEKVDLIPRLTDSIVNVAIGPENLKLAICTADNGIQILNALHKQTAAIQSFSKISADVPGEELFPAGMRVNPRTQAIIMNGRVGCIQFFSTYTKSLLYTLDITLRNYNTNEEDNVIHNTVVSNIAVNAHWLATVENWNDHHNSIETRLKFWKYDESRQTYALNTNLENVHQGGVCEIAFSSRSREHDLQCATAGEDHRIKVWSLEGFETNGQNPKFVWSCVGSVQHRNLPVRSISYSQDASLLAGGFGNVLCIWNTETLHLKCAVSAPSGYDGCVNKALVILPTNGHGKSTTKNTTTTQGSLDDARSKIIAEIVALSIGEVKSSIFEKIRQDQLKQPFHHRMYLSRRDWVTKLSENLKKSIMQKVQLSSKLSLSQKAELFQALQIACRTNERMENHIKNRLLTFTQSARKMEYCIQKICGNLSRRYRFCFLRKRRYFEHRKQNPAVVGEGIEQTFLNKIAERNVGENDGTIKKYKSDDETVKKNPVRSFSQIKNVLFCYGQFAHLVVVNTESRLIVWNLLSLKMQVSAALTMDRIALDPITNLIATFTKDNALYVFLPNIPMPLYHRINMPKVFGAVWIPRRYPSAQSFNVDWQSTSQLFFLNSKQELQHLVSDSDEESLRRAESDDEDTIATNESMNNFSVGLKTPFAAMISKQSIGSAVQTNTGRRSGLSVGLAEKSVIRDIVSSSSHTMAPISMMCKDFLRSLLVSEKSRSKENASEGQRILNRVTTPSNHFVDTYTLDEGNRIGNDAEPSDEVVGKEPFECLIHNHDAQNQETVPYQQFMHLSNDLIDIVF